MKNVIETDLTGKVAVVTGASGTAKWSSDNTSVVTVADDGTVTAVDKGTATVTAEVDGKKLNCEVRCIW